MADQQTSKKRAPLVSVVVPNYNHARYLPRRLETIAAQSFSDFELIVLDDASTDESLAVINQYSQTIPMRVVRNEKNSGSSFVQWRRGAELARARYLWIAESDDFAHPEFLETLVDVLDRQANVGLAYSESIVINSDGQELGTYLDHYLNSNAPQFDRERWLADFVVNGRTECANYLAFMNTIPNASAVLLRRDLFLRQSYAIKPLRLMGDWAIWVGMLLTSDLAYVARPLNYFREHSGTVRKTIGWGASFHEHCIISAHLAKEFRRDRKTRQRIRQHVAETWRRKYREISAADNWRWFLRVMKLQWVIGARNLPLFSVTYGFVRVVRSRRLQPVRSVVARYLKPRSSLQR